MDWWKWWWIFIVLTYLKFSLSSKIIGRDENCRRSTYKRQEGSWEESRNAWGVPQGIPWGVPWKVPRGVPQGVPRGVPRGVQNSSRCQYSSKISCLDKNRRPSTSKCPGGPGRAPGTPGGSLRGFQKSRGSSTIQVTSSTSSLVCNADAGPYHCRAHYNDCRLMELGMNYIQNVKSHIIINFFEL